EENARSVLIISIKNQQRLFRTSPQAAAVVPVHNAAAAAWGMIDERVEHRRHLRPMHKVCADCVAPPLVCRASSRPFVEDIEQVKLAPVRDQTGGVTNMPLQHGVV